MSVFSDWSINKGNIKGRIILIAYRLASRMSKLKGPFKVLCYPYVIFYRIFFEWVLGVELPWRLRVGSGLRLYHGYALVVSDRAVIGSNCVLRHSTTIGVAGTDLNFEGGAPVIGDNVDIGSNVVIIGAITVGSGSIIGAGSVVVKDVPPNAVVVGNPARIVRYKS